MPKPIVYDSNQFDVPAGKYIGRLTEVVDKEPYQGESKYGPNSNEPRLGWRWEVIGPPGSPALGKVIEQGTGTHASKKSGLVRLLTFLLGRMPHEGERIDPASFIGKDYTITWAVNPRSDVGNCHVAYLEAVTPAGAGPSSPPHTPAPTGMAAPPAPNAGQRVPVPTPPPPPASPPSVAPTFWVHMPDGRTVEMSRATVQMHLDTGDKPAEEVQLMDQSRMTDGWRKASDFGFKKTIPF